MSNKAQIGSVLCLLALFAGQQALGGTPSDASAPFSPQKPRHELRLNLKEFSVLNSAARLGVSKYGGTASFEVMLARDKKTDVSWKVTIRNPKLIEVLEYWMAEKTAELVRLLDFDNLDTASKSALQTVKSISAKITEARANPIWNSIELSGVVIQDRDRWLIESKQGKYQVTGSKLEELKALNGKSIVATGYIKIRGQIEVSRYREKKGNTLELFAMSFCPFSRKAEASVIEFLETYPGNPKPVLEIHYIFYRHTENGRTVFTSLHGDREVEENLVQMVIRDTHPECYHKYLLARARSDVAWDQLGTEIGLTKDDVASIRSVLKQDAEALIQAEYAYVAGVHGIYDASPAYVWEGERVSDIRTVKAFSDLEFVSQSCSEDG